MKTLRQIDRALARFEGWFIVAFLWLMVVLTFCQVSLRGLYTHGHFQWANALMGTLDWSEPLVRLLVLWLTFLGASLITGENKHIKIDLFSSLLPEKLLRLRDLILDLVCILVCSMMLRTCLSYLNMEMQFGAKIFLGLPAWTGQLIIPAGFALILFRFLLGTIEKGFRIFGGKTR